VLVPQVALALVQALLVLRAEPVLPAELAELVAPELPD